MAQQRRVAVGDLQVGDRARLRLLDGAEVDVNVVRRVDEDSVPWIAFQTDEGWVYEARERNGQFVYANGVEDLQVVVAFQVD